MNGLDITLICLTGLGLVKGLFDGIIKQVVSLIAILVVLFFSGKVSLMLRDWIASLELFSDTMVTPISYILAILIIFGVLILAGEVTHRVVGATPLSIINHLLGGALGVLVMLLICSALINLFEVVDAQSNILSADKKEASKLYYPIESIIPTIYPHLSFPKW
jgi:membrane protein required for colicin V production